MEFLILDAVGVKFPLYREIAGQNGMLNVAGDLNALFPVRKAPCMHLETVLIGSNNNQIGRIGQIGKPVIFCFMIHNILLIVNKKRLAEPFSIA
ncbi:MAG: hypothetical protein KH256_09570 [Clostridiales bacterium]|nr:hypothetical protein [Clostridiales bacterium]